MTYACDVLVTLYPCHSPKALCFDVNGHVEAFHFDVNDRVGVSRFDVNGYVEAFGVPVCPSFRRQNNVQLTESAILGESASVCSRARV